MGMFTVIPKDTFDQLEMDAGILLTSFDPTAPKVVDSAIVCATTGGVNPTCVPTFSDMGEDIDNCPTNMKELKHLDSWECKFAFTALGNSPKAIKLALGCADIDGTNTSKIVPRKDLSQDDFADIWWVGDKTNGGFVAIRLINALSTSGYSLQTDKNSKGQMEMELTGHVSLDDQTKMPMEFYSYDSTASTSTSGGDSGSSSTGA